MVAAERVAGRTVDFVHPFYLTLLCRRGQQPDPGSRLFQGVFPVEKLKPAEAVVWDHARDGRRDPAARLHW